MKLQPFKYISILYSKDSNSKLGKYMYNDFVKDCYKVLDEYHAYSEISYAHISCDLSYKMDGKSKKKCLFNDDQISFLHDVFEYILNVRYHGLIIEREDDLMEEIDFKSLVHLSKEQMVSGMTILILEKMRREIPKISGCTWQSADEWDGASIAMKHIEQIT